MTPDLVSLRTTLAKVASHDAEGLTKTAVSELPELPEQTWEGIRQLIKENKLGVREMAVYATDFGIFASSGEKLRFELFKYGAIGVVIAVAVATITYSPWSLLLMPLALLPLQLAKGLYRRVLAESAVSSEFVFAFLFSRNMIYLFGDGKSYYRDNRPKDVT